MALLHSLRNCLNPFLIQVNYNLPKAVDYRGRVYSRLNPFLIQVNYNDVQVDAANVSTNGLNPFLIQVNYNFSVCVPEWC